jgi:hypothetical protein
LVDIATVTGAGAPPIADDTLGSCTGRPHSGHLILLPASPASTLMDLPQPHSTRSMNYLVNQKEPSPDMRNRIQILTLFSLP